MEKHGMFKGGAYGPGGSVCAVGALSEVNYDWKSGDIIDEVAAELFPDRRAEYPGYRPVAAVNDHPDTTLDDMRVIFEKAQIRQDERFYD
jgi:hypothetical protein